MTFRDEVEALLSRMEGAAGLLVRTERGAGSLGWDPVDEREKAAAECVILEGPDCFGALCRIGGAVRYVTGLKHVDCDSRMWPIGESDTLEAALEIAIPLALRKYEPPPGK